MYRDRQLLALSLALALALAMYVSLTQINNKCPNPTLTVTKKIQ